MDIINNGLKNDVIERSDITCSPKIPHNEHEECTINAEIEKRF